MIVVCKEFKGVAKYIPVHNIKPFLYNIVSLIDSQHHLTQNDELLCKRVIADTKEHYNFQGELINKATLMENINVMLNEGKKLCISDIKYSIFKGEE